MTCHPSPLATVVAATTATVNGAPGLAADILGDAPDLELVACAAIGFLAGLIQRVADTTPGATTDSVLAALGHAAAHLDPR